MSSADSNSIARRVSSATRGRSQQTGRIVSIHSYRGGTGKSNISANLAYGDQLNKLIDELKLDLLPIDTHPGFDEETLLTIAISDTLLIVLRPDKQDYHGTAVLVEVAGGMA